MKIFQNLVGLAAIAGVMASSAASAQMATRSAGTLPVAASAIATPMKLTRASKGMDSQSNFFGLPIAFIVLGVVAAITVVVVVADGDSDSAG